jgi:D-inositol-3-phosphate glycosyltransferase
MVPSLKNPVDVALAFSRLADRFPEWRAEFAGQDITVGRESTWAACERILSRFPGRYRYHGALEPADLAQLYRRASILVLPSRFESFGLVALEAMSAGCVPVVTDGTALPEVVGDGGVVVQQGCIDRLTDEIAALIMDPQRRHALSGRAVMRSTTWFSRQQVLARNLHMFEAVLAAHRKGRGQ